MRVCINSGGDDAAFSGFYLRLTKSDFEPPSLWFCLGLVNFSFDYIIGFNTNCLSMFTRSGGLEPPFAADVAEY